MPLYHVTPATNQESILASGVDPVFSQGKRQISWWVTRERLAWAIAHTALKHHVMVEDLVIFSTYRPLKNMRKTRWSGVVTTTCNQRVDHLTTPKSALLHILDNVPV